MLEGKTRKQLLPVTMYFPYWPKQRKQLAEKAQQYCSRSMSGKAEKAAIANASVSSVSTHFPIYLWYHLFLYPEWIPTSKKINALRIDLIFRLVPGYTAAVCYIEVLD